MAADTAIDTRGRDAATPAEIPARGWLEIAKRTWAEAGEDNVGLVAAGVAFYGFLAMVPLLGAVVMSYGLIADPRTVVANMQSLTSVMPADAAKLIGEQLMNVVTASGGKKGLGLLLALAIALYGATKGAGAVVTALNIAYEEKESRGFVRLTALTFGITAAAVVVAIVAIVSVASLGHLDTLIPWAPPALLFAGRLLSYVLMAAVGAAAAAALYRYGPDRANATWVWLTPGSIVATLLWLALTLGFGIYVANFGSYDATYGSLGAVVVLLTWLYLSAYVLILGGELNSEIEHQTARDTTDGHPLPMGARGAAMADSVADGPDDKNADAATPGTGLGSDNTPRGLGADMAVARGTAVASRLIGSRVAFMPSLLATGGLATLRKRNGTPLGLALLGAGALLAWRSRERQPDDGR